MSLHQKYKLYFWNKLICCKDTKKSDSFQAFCLNDFIEEQLQDPVFKEKYDALEPEFTVMQAMIDARKEKGIEDAIK